MGDVLAGCVRPGAARGSDGTPTYQMAEFDSPAAAGLLANIDTT